MTRLPDGVSRPGQKRVVDSSRGDLVLVLTDRTITMKPKGARSNGVYTMTWGMVYQRAVEIALAEQRRAKSKTRRKR